MLKIAHHKQPSHSSMMLTSAALVVSWRRNNDAVAGVGQGIEQGVQVRLSPAIVVGGYNVGRPNGEREQAKGHTELHD